MPDTKNLRFISFKISLAVFQACVFIFAFMTTWAWSVPPSFSQKAHETLQGFSLFATVFIIAAFFSKSRRVLAIASLLAAAEAALMAMVIVS